MRSLLGRGVVVAYVTANDSFLFNKLCTLSGYSRKTHRTHFSGLRRTDMGVLRVGQQIAAAFWLIPL